MKKFLTLLLLSSCTQFVQNTDSGYFDEVSKNKDKIQIFFTHNINGETHPCGCRKFPLGGLPQANGIMESTRKDFTTLYLDTGDTFFESPTVPAFIAKSSRYNALRLAEGLDKIGLKFMTPGDQDFAMGEELLVEIANKVKFKFLISNGSKKLKIPHQDLIHFERSGKHFFFIGVLDPDLLRSEYKKLFVNPAIAIEKSLKKIDSIESDKSQRTIFLLSHSGLDEDEKLAKTYQDLDWIIGGHSQSYLRFTKDVGNTKLAQVLSRNHYIGKIIVPLDKKAKYKYEVLETRDETQNLISPNPMISWLTSFKTELDKVQAEEQKSTSAFIGEVDNRIPTYISCSDCHKEQVSFWQSTSHSLAYLTLVHEKATNNRSCVKCHSVGMGKEGGFAGPKQIIQDEKGSVDLDKYLGELSKSIKVKHPIRKLSGKETKKIAQKWIKLDLEKKITANHSNVQCLNCHNQDMEHPFGEVSEVKIDYKSKCLECHTRNQSPEWYNKDSKGLASSLNDKYFHKKLKQVSCPKIER